MTTINDVPLAQPDSRNPEAGLSRVVDQLVAALPDGEGADLVRDSVSLQLKAADAYRTDMADLDRNWAHLPVGAHAERQRVAKATLQEALDTAAKVGQAGAEVLLTTLEDRALPKRPTPGMLGDRAAHATREHMDREELMLLTKGGTTADFRTQLLAIAQSPRRDLAALLFTPWGESLMRSRGVATDEFRNGLRTAAIEAAANHGTDAQRAALAKLKRARKAVAATTAARALANMRRQQADAARNRRARAEERIRNRTLDLQNPGG